MAEAHIPAAWLKEAEDMDTPAKRLEELASYPALQPLIAANPASPADLLEYLGNMANPVLRRAVVQNPNTPVPLLGKLAGEFPGEFMNNPLLPLLNITQPGFARDFSFFSWSSLLRRPDLPVVWLQQVQKDVRFQRNQAPIWKLVHLHVSMIKQNTPIEPAGDVVRAYRKQLPETERIAPRDEFTVFFLCLLLLPSTRAMLRKQWKVAASFSSQEKVMLAPFFKGMGRETVKMLLRERQEVLLRSEVAGCRTASPATWNLLATHELRGIRLAVANNPSTPLEIIYRLMVDKEARVRAATVRHAQLGQTDLEILLLDASPRVRAALAGRPHLPISIGQQLVSDASPLVRAALACNLFIGPDFLSVLASDQESMVRMAVAGNPLLSAELQSILLQDSDPQVRASLSGNASLQAASFERLAQDSSVLVRRYLAANPRTPIAVVERLWQSGEHEIWPGLVRHPALSVEILRQLAHQGDLSIRMAVASHSRTPAELLEELASENHPRIWEVLINNPHTPLHILERALQVCPVQRWESLAKHPAMRQAGLRPLLNLFRERLRPLIQGNSLPGWLRLLFVQYYTALPIEISGLFAESPYWQERYLLARRPHTPVEILQVLANDGICHVRNAAQEILQQNQQASKE